MAATDQTISMLGKIAGYVEILSRDPHSTAFVSLAEVYRQMGMLDDAIEVAQKGVTALPQFSPGFTALGRIQAQRGHLPEARSAFERAHALDPGSLPALKGLARVAGMQGERERARELLEAARQLQPEDATVLKMLASLGPAPSAQPPAPAPGGGGSRAVEAAVEPSEVDDRQAPIATPTIAEIYVKQGLPQKALRVYRDLLAAHPENPDLAARCRDLEKLLAGPATDVAVSAEPVPGSEPEPQIASVEDPQEQVLVTLNRWLDAIHDRRDDVR